MEKIENIRMKKKWLQTDGGQKCQLGAERDEREETGSKYGRTFALKKENV